MSIEAIGWALNLAPVPIDRSARKNSPNSACASVLTGLANHADPYGRNAFPGVRTLMRYTRLSERTVQTALDRLEADGIISPCDPAIVAAYIRRADKRTQGWNLAMHLIRQDLTEQDLEDLERLYPGVRQRYEQQHGGVQPLHPADENGETAGQGPTASGVQPLHPANGVQPFPERGATVAPEASGEPQEALSPLRGDSAAPARTHMRVAEPGDDVKDRPADVDVDVDAGAAGGPAQDGLPGVAEDSASKKTRERRIRLPLDWTPDEELRAQTRELGMADDAMIDATVLDFRRYWCGIKETTTRTPRGWDDTWRNWARKDLKDAARRRTQRPDAEPLADAAAEAAVMKITEWWWGRWSRRGPILGQSRTDLERLVRGGIAASMEIEPLVKAARRVQEALDACERPVPFRDQFQRALLGENPGSGHSRTPYTGERWADGSAGAALEAWGQQGPPQGGADAPTVPAPSLAADDVSAAPAAVPDAVPEAGPPDEGENHEARFMRQWGALAGGRDVA
ncbi:helix-turn-helix domain-containing protein [Streptosporangium sp. NPDC051023]|uniref:helix-turn-helix domain-containing protein n=1 Tax=Streptosporangium sp. NPDC051023 TaxID=3155410 RepID=UPI00345105EC